MYIYHFVIPPSFQYINFLVHLRLLSPHKKNTQLISPSYWSWTPGFEAYTLTQTFTIQVQFYPSSSPPFTRTYWKTTILLTILHISLHCYYPLVLLTRVQDHFLEEMKLLILASIRISFMKYLIVLTCLIASNPGSSPLFGKSSFKGTLTPIL